MIAMQQWARRGRYLHLIAGTPWHPHLPEAYPPPWDEPWTSTIWDAPGRVVGLAERCTARLRVPPGLALAHASAIALFRGRDLISCLTLVARAILRSERLMEEAARAIGSSGPLGAPRWEQDGQNDLVVAAWRAGGRDSGITAQPDWGDGLLTAPRRRRRGPNEEPPRGTEQFGAMWPWCSPVGLEEEDLMGIIGGMVGVLDLGHGESALADLSLLFGYEPTSEVMGVAGACADLLEEFCLNLPPHLRRVREGDHWAASLPRRGRVPSYLDIAASDQRLSALLGVSTWVGALPSDDGDGTYEGTLRYVNIRVSPVAVRWASWCTDPRKGKVNGLHHFLLLAIRYIRYGNVGDPGEPRLVSHAELEHLIAILHSMYVSTEDVIYRCSQARRRVTDQLVMWLVCDPMRHTPASEEAAWKTGCATLYRIEAMRRLGHADRARLAVLISALFSVMPSDMLQCPLYPCLLYTSPSPRDS